MVGMPERPVAKTGGKWELPMTATGTITVARVVPTMSVVISGLAERVAIVGIFFGYFAMFRDATGDSRVLTPYVDPPAGIPAGDGAPT